MGVLCEFGKRDKIRCEKSTGVQEKGGRNEEEKATTSFEKYKNLCSTLSRLNQAKRSLEKGLGHEMNIMFVLVAFNFLGSFLLRKKIPGPWYNVFACTHTGIHVSINSENPFWNSLRHSKSCLFLSKLIRNSAVIL
jgi:hypothetical protein